MGKPYRREVALRRAWRWLVMNCEPSNKALHSDDNSAALHCHR